MLKQLKFRGIQQGLIDGLRRGIGVHHEGVGKRKVEPVAVSSRYVAVRLVKFAAHRPYSCVIRPQV